MNPPRHAGGAKATKAGHAAPRGTRGRTTQIMSMCSTVWRHIRPRRPRSFIGNFLAAVGVSLAGVLAAAVCLGLYAITAREFIEGRSPAIPLVIIAGGVLLEIAIALLRGRRSRRVRA